MKNKALFIVIFALLASCNSMSKTPPTSKFQQIQIINGEVDACSLWSPEIIETELNVKINQEASEFEGATACRYFSSDDNQNILLAVVYTDTTLQKARKPYTASEWFEQSKKINIHDVNEAGAKAIDNVPQIGEQAYYVEGTAFLELHFLKSNIEYVILTPNNEKSSLSFDSLVNMARIVSQRAP